MNSNTAGDDELTMPTRFLGIDPGLNRTGYAILEYSLKGPVLCEGGIIRSNKDLNLAARVHEIGSG
ncbi:MAG: crossover junction endodeoxyribonuclease RuvC, partial [Gimesia sp.]